MIVEESPFSGTNRPAFDSFGDLSVSADAEPDIDRRKALSQRRDVPLGITTGDDDTDAGTFRLFGQGGPNPIVGLVAGRTNKAAGVENQDVSPAGIADEVIARGQKMPGHHLAVDEVFCAAVIDDRRLGLGLPGERRFVPFAFRRIPADRPALRLAQG